MPANLPRLVESSPAVDVQRTTFSVDALGRYICSQWDEAVASGGAQFDAVVIGAGMYGAYCAEKTLFPTAGSVDPVLTGLCLARGIAEAIA